MNRLVALVPVLALLAAPAGAKRIDLLNVSYDPTRELYKEINAAFIKAWKAAKRPAGFKGAATLTNPATRDSCRRVQGCGCAAPRREIACSLSASNRCTFSLSKTTSSRSKGWSRMLASIRAISSCPSSER